MCLSYMNYPMKVDKYGSEDWHRKDKGVGFRHHPNQREQCADRKCWLLHIPVATIGPTASRKITRIKRCNKESWKTGTGVARIFVWALPPSLPACLPASLPSLPPSLPASLSLPLSLSLTLPLSLSHSLSLSLSLSRPPDGLWSATTNTCIPRV